jgi:kynurenine 3-monooxygenase
MKKKIIITGAGLVGTLLSIYLARRGYRVAIFERRNDMRREKINAGRSINLALSDRGIVALNEVGIMDRIREIAIPMHGRFLHQPDGSNHFQPYGQSGQFINSVSRGDLNRKLMDLAEQQGATIYFNQKCTGVDWKNKEIFFEGADKSTSIESFDLLFGADGAYSACRLQHQLHQDRFQYDQYYIDYGYKELTIPAGGGGEFRLEKNALHIWPRGNYMLIALPNIDGSFTCTLFFPFEGRPSFASLGTDKEVRAFFATTFADAYGLMPELTKEFFTNPTSSLITVRCFPWVREDHFALIGDAAHAIVPFFGQGMNCGFEDCHVLNDLIETYGDDWTAILAAFQQQRKPDADAIAELALNNFVEMRDKVADPRFLLQKKIEAALHQQYSDKWIPAYSQVTFSPHIRYSQALTNARRQEAIMKEVMAQKDIEQNWSDQHLHRQIIDRLERISKAET